MAPGLALVKSVGLALEEVELIGDIRGLAVGGIAGTDELLQPEVFKILGEKMGEIAPLRVIAGKEHRLIPKYIRVKFQIGIDFPLNILILGIKLIAFSSAYHKAPHFSIKFSFRHSF